MILQRILCKAAKKENIPKMCFKAAKHFGCTYNELIQRKTKSYCLKDRLKSLHCLSFEEATSDLQCQITNILDDIDVKMKPNFCIDEFTVGKSFVRQRRKKKGYVEFDDLDPHTWKLDNGVNGRWKTYYNVLSYDGLVVLCVTPRTVIPANQMHIEPQDYALALEQRLIQNFCLIKKDFRLGNKSFDTGSKARNPYAGLVYVAYKLQKMVRPK